MRLKSVAIALSFALFASAAFGQGAAGSAAPAGSAGTAAPVRPKLLGVGGVVFSTSDMAAAREFYGDYLGFGQLPGGTVAAKAAPAGAMLFKVNDSQLITICPEVKGTAQAPTGRLLRADFLTDDVKGMRKYLLSRGYEVLAAISEKDGDRSFLFTAPGGLNIRFVEQTERGMAARGKGKYLAKSRLSDRLSHVGFAVADIDRARAFYCGVLGFVETDRGGPTWIFMTFPDGTDAIELMLEMRNPKNNIPPYKNHFNFDTGDIHATWATLESRKLPAGCRIEPVVKGKDGKLLINIFDPDGTRVEFIETYVREENK